MNKHRLLSTLTLLVALSNTACATAVSGDWKVIISTAEGTIVGKASLTQSGNTVAGWVGPSEKDPIQITGTLKNGKLTMKTLPRPGRTVAFDEVDLTVDRDQMFGVIQRGSHGEGTIRFTRSQ